jgi:alkyl hydroperoxide reductase subunit AhpC
LDVNFPLVDDSTRQVAQRYGMIMPGEGVTGSDWYFCTKEISKDDVFAAITRR